MHGGGYFDGTAEDGVVRLPVLLVSPDRQLTASADSITCSDRLDPSEVVLVQGVPCTRPERATFDEMRSSGLWGAVGAMDMAAAAGLTSVAQLQGYVRFRDNRRWTAVVAEALSYADDHSASPQETRMRLVWVLVAGLPRPTVQPPGVLDLR